MLCMYMDTWMGNVIAKAGIITCIFWTIYWVIFLNCICVNNFILEGYKVQIWHKCQVHLRLCSSASVFPSICLYVWEWRQMKCYIYKTYFISVLLTVGMQFICAIQGSILGHYSLQLLSYVQQDFLWYLTWIFNIYLSSFVYLLYCYSQFVILFIFTLFLDVLVILEGNFLCAMLKICYLGLQILYFGIQLIESSCYY